MKTKNRNKNFNSRLARSLCLMAVGVFGAGGILSAALILTSSQSSFAANLTAVEDNWSTIDGTEVQFKLDKILLSRADDIDLSGDLVELDNTNYRYLPQSFANEDNLIAISKTGSANGAKAILRWNEAALYPDGTKLDVEMTFDNFEITPYDSVQTSGADMNYIYVAADWTNLDTDETYLYHAAYFGVVKYDITARVFASGSTTPVVKKTILRFLDLDNGENNDCAASVDREGVTLIDGVADGKIHLMQNPKVQICDTSYGSNTRVVGTGLALDTPDTGFAAYVDTGSMKYRWTGTQVATGIGFIDFFVVKTSKSGPYANKGSITPTDREVFWKEDKEITMTPDEGYKVSKVTVDGQEVSFTPNQDGVVEYTFDDVVSNHAIDVQFEPTAGYKVTTHHYIEGTATPISDDVIQDGFVYDQPYATTPASDIDDEYELVAIPDNATGEIKGDTEVIYYYRKKGTVIVRFCDKATGKCELAPPEIDEGKDGEESEICKPKTISGYILVDKNAKYNCVYDKDINEIKIWYQKNQNPKTFDEIDTNMIAGVFALLGGASLFVCGKRRR